MTALLYDPAKKKHVLLLGEGAWAGRCWSVNLHVCGNPCCGCLHIDFECTPDDAEIGLDKPAVRFVLDTGRPSVHRDDNHKSGTPGDKFADAVAKELGDEGWDYLQQFLLGIKKKQIENCDPTCLDADFPPEVLQGEGTMVSYNEIFPLSPAFGFSIGSERWFALDDYCVSPDCDCREVVLQFVTEGHEPDDFPADAEDAPLAVFYDYRKRTFKQAQAPEAHKPSLRILLSGLEDQRPGFDAEVKERHLRLKALFKRALSKFDDETEGTPFVEDSEFEPDFQMGGEAPLHTPKPGRSEHCPCGSGKKYKKCCGS
jgi:hypothetical protein